MFTPPTMMPSSAQSAVGDANRLQALLREDLARVKLHNGEGLNLLHITAREGHVAAVRTLLAAGADVMAVDDHPNTDYRGCFSNGWTALHLAAMAGNKEVVDALLDRGADVNAADKYGKLTPLHYAAWQGNTGLIAVLLARKADRTAKDEQGRTPLALAEERKNAAAIKLLKR